MAIQLQCQITPSNPLAPTSNTDETGELNQKDKYNETVYVHPPASIQIEPDNEENESIPHLVEAQEGAAHQQNCG